MIWFCFCLSAVVSSTVKVSIFNEENELIMCLFNIPLHTQIQDLAQHFGNFMPWMAPCQIYAPPVLLAPNLSLQQLQSFSFDTLLMKSELTQQKLHFYWEQIYLEKNEQLIHSIDTRSRREGGEATISVEIISLSGGLLSTLNNISRQSTIHDVVDALKQSMNFRTYGKGHDYLIIDEQILAMHQTIEELSPLDEVLKLTFVKGSGPNAKKIFNQKL